MLVTKFNPVSALPAPFRFFEEALNDLIQEPATGRPWAPSVDILETENELIVKADLPEVKLDDISIHLENGILSLKGERKFEHNENKAGYHRLERGYGSFARNFSIPETVDAEQVKAAFKDGVLTVTLPKKEVAKPRAIKVNVAG
ncbi:MAG: Hsp20/alpha crystallin family protein [Bryobacteraceae bacterium]